MTNEKIYDSLLYLLDVVEPDDYPETYDIIASAIETSANGFEALRLASELHEADNAEIMHPDVSDFLIDLYLSEIAEGNAEAMCSLGALYYTGRGGEQDYAKAVEYYTMAAEKGNRQAQENLGYCYYYGRSVDIDYKKAYHYFVKGALDGHLNSLYKIGDMYKNGYYVEQDEKEAFLLYMRCLDTMTDETAQGIAGPVYLRLGDAFLYGKGTEEDSKTALICYQKAEVFLRDMIMNGDFYYRASLENAIKGQTEARKKITESIPGFGWTE